jgi:hypothetical protein
MNETLAAGQVRRTLTVADLNIAEAPEGADPERAAPMASDPFVFAAASAEVQPSGALFGAGSELQLLNAPEALPQSAVDSLRLDAAYIPSSSLDNPLRLKSVEAGPPAVDGVAIFEVSALPAPRQTQAYDNLFVRGVQQVAVIGSPSLPAVQSAAQNGRYEGRLSFGRAAASPRTGGTTADLVWTRAEVTAVDATSAGESDVHDGHWVMAVLFVASALVNPSNAKGREDRDRYFADLAERRDRHMDMDRFAW